MQRREAFQELIALTHSSYSLLKSYAAGHIHVFFNDFPDLEEDAINAVYDLCEDQDSKVGGTRTWQGLNCDSCLSPQVRMDGYHAVTQVSSIQHKWVKRNADVLVQLLQSGKSFSGLLTSHVICLHLDHIWHAFLVVDR